MLATKKMTPTDPPNSGPRARLIMTGLERCQGLSMMKTSLTYGIYVEEPNSHSHICKHSHTVCQSTSAVIRRNPMSTMAKCSDQKIKCISQ